MDWHDDLDYYAGEEYEPDDDGPPPDLTDADHVDRVLRTIGFHEREAAQIKALAAAEVARITAWASDRLDGIERRLAWHSRAVEAWMRKVNAEDPKRKSVSLPNGTPQLRKRVDRVHVPKDLAPAVTDTLEAIDEQLVERVPRVVGNRLKAIAQPGSVIDYAPEGADGYALHEAVVCFSPWPGVVLPLGALPEVGLLVGLDAAFSIRPARTAEVVADDD